jgi:hypothetical protein
MSESTITHREQVTVQRDGEETRWSLMEFDRERYLLSITTPSTLWQVHLDRAAVDQVRGMFCRFGGAA